MFILSKYAIVNSRNVYYLESVLKFPMMPNKESK